MTLVINSILSVILVLILYIAYIKIKYPFWHRQPVLHKYDFWRCYTSASFVIHENPIKVEKFYDDVRIQTFLFNVYDNDTVEKFIDFLQIHYINLEDVMYVANKKNLSSHFIGQNTPSFISYYKSTDSSDIKGCITSRSCNLCFANHIFPAYYMDNICIHKNVSKNIIYQLIQTHEYKLRKLNNKIKISFFKKEVKLCDGVIPVVEYETSLFKLSKQHKLKELPPKVSCVRITKNNFNIFTDFLDNIKKTEFVAVSDIGNLFSLLKEEELFIYCLHHGKDILGMYFFKDSRIIYDKCTLCNGRALNLISSFNNIISTDLFVLGLHHALKIICRIYNFEMLIFDNISHNDLLLSSICEFHNIIVKYKCAYYLYNFVIPKMPLKSKKCFIIV